MKCFVSTRIVSTHLKHTLRFRKSEELTVSNEAAKVTSHNAMPGWALPLIELDKQLD